MEKPLIGLNLNPKAKELQGIYLQKIKPNIPQKLNSQYGSRKLNDIVSQSSQNPMLFDEDNLKRISCDDQPIFGNDPTCNGNMEISLFENGKSRKNLIELKKDEYGVDIPENELEKNYFRIKNIHHANSNTNIAYINAHANDNANDNNGNVNANTNDNINAHPNDKGNVNAYTNNNADANGNSNVNTNDNGNANTRANVNPNTNDNGNATIDNTNDNTNGYTNDNTNANAEYLEV